MKLKFDDAMSDLPAVFDHKYTEHHEEDGALSVRVNVRLEYPEGVFRQNHTIILSCPDLDFPDEYGIDYLTDDGDIGSISPDNIMTQFYFDLALKDIEEEHLL